MAITTEAGVCNVALGLLGQPGVTALVDDPEDATSKAQKWCSRLYPFVRDNLLECHPWYWASTLAQLTVDNNHPPLWGFTYAYPLPANFLRLCELVDDDSPFSIENHPTLGRRMLTDLDEVYIRYVWAVTNVSLFPAFFVEALVRQLVAELRYPLTGERSDIKLLVEMAYVALNEAKRLDYGYELSQPDKETSDWISARTL